MCECARECVSAIEGVYDVCYSALVKVCLRSRCPAPAPVPHRMPAPRDALLGQLADKRKAVARRKPKGLISRDGKGRVVAKVEVNGQKSKRGGYMVCHASLCRQV